MFFISIKNIIFLVTAKHVFLKNLEEFNLCVFLKKDCFYLRNQIGIHPSTLALKEIFYGIDSDFVLVELNEEQIVKINNNAVIIPETALTFEYSEEAIDKYIFIVVGYPISKSNELIKSDSISRYL